MRSTFLTLMSGVLVGLPPSKIYITTGTWICVCVCTNKWPGESKRERERERMWPSRSYPGRVSDNRKSEAEGSLPDLLDNV